jgi:DNA-binding NarL/FixJ family response regulator
MTKANKNGSGTVSVVLASASAVRRAGLEAIVKAAPQLRLVASLQGTHTAIQRALDSRADVLLADLENDSSLALENPITIAAVVLIDNPDPAWSAFAVRSGVKAILSRDSGCDEIVPAILAAYSGFLLLDARVGLDLASQARARSWQADSSGKEVTGAELTARELEVLSMLSEGVGNREIASRLGVSDHTIKFHISSILDKLGASNRTEAVTIALRMGLILL